MINAIQIYRFSNWAYRRKIPVLPRLCDYVSRLVFNCWIPHKAAIGRDVTVGYGGLAIVIHDDSVIGNGVEIDQGVTIGGDARRAGVAVIGDRCYIGAGAKILGPITIGEGCVIGANSVVIADIPPHSVAVGMPARVVRRDIDVDTFLFHRAAKH